jgi:hypothetical protein
MFTEQYRAKASEYAKLLGTGLKCRKLRAAGGPRRSIVELTSAQKQLKRKMVVWYSTYCIRTRSA